jgi:hypothetical protein
MLWIRLKNVYYIINNLNIFFWGGESSKAMVIPDYSTPVLTNINPNNNGFENPNVCLNFLFRCLNTRIHPAPEIRINDSGAKPWFR